MIKEIQVLMNNEDIKEIITSMTSGELLLKCENKERALELLDEVIDDYVECYFVSSLDCEDYIKDSNQVMESLEVVEEIGTCNIFCVAQELLRNEIKNKIDDIIEANELMGEN